MKPFKLVLHYPVEPPTGGMIRAVVLEPPSTTELIRMAIAGAIPPDPIECRLAVYAIATGLDLEIVQEFDVADLWRIETALNNLYSETLQ